MKIQTWNHLANLNKYKDQRDRPDLSAPESLQVYPDTRFEQLKIATELRLFQATIFIMLMHDSSYFLRKRVLTINKNLTQKDLQLIASSVVLASLSVSPYNQTRGASHLELENEKECNLRIANLIGFNLESKLDNREVLSRSAVLAELVSKGVLSCAAQEVKDLYHLLENDVLPLDVASKIQSLLLKISKLGGKLTSVSSLPEVQQSCGKKMRKKRKRRKRERDEKN